MKSKETKEKKQKMSTADTELSDTKTAFPAVETRCNSAVKVDRKRLKAQKKLSSLPDSGVIIDAEPTSTTNECGRSAFVDEEASSPVKRRPAKSDRNSGVVRIIDKSRRKRVRRTDDIEDALQLDVGIGSGHW